MRHNVANHALVTVIICAICVTGAYFFAGAGLYVGAVLSLTFAGTVCVWDIIFLFVRRR
jgi:hypothetical protein